MNFDTASTELPRRLYNLNVTQTVGIRRVSTLMPDRRKREEGEKEKCVRDHDVHIHFCQPTMEEERWLRRASWLTVKQGRKRVTTSMGERKADGRAGRVV